MSEEAKNLKRMLGPLRLFLGPVVDIADHIRAQVESETVSEEEIMRRLRELGQQLDDGEISEEQYDEAEAVLLEHLDRLEAEREDE